MNPLSRLFQRRRLDRELAAEMREHLEENIQRNLDAGQSPADARANAHRQFGNPMLHVETSREAWGWTTIEQSFQDFGFALRMLRKTPVLTAAAVLALALGIGANTAMFSVVKAVLLASLPYPDPGQLVQVWETRKDGGLASVSGLNFRDWRDQNRSLRYLSSFGTDIEPLSGDFQPQRVRIGVVSKDFFTAMGVAPIRGHTFLPDEQKPGAAPTIILGYDLWHSLFASSEQVLGKTVRISGNAATIVGVMPLGFDFPQRSQVWLPSEITPDTSTRSAHNYKVIGRMNPGATLNTAQADMNTVGARLAREYADDRDRGIRVVSLHDQIAGPVKPALMILLGAVGFVLLIACVNVANLQIARASGRGREMAMRTALGAGRGRLFRQLIIENVVLSTLGGLTGLALAWWGTAVLRASIPASIPRVENIRVDEWVLAFTAGVSLLAGLLFGIFPALTASRADVNDTLKEGTAKSTFGPRQRLLGQVLVIGEIGIAMVLLIGAALLVESFWKLAHVNPGFVFSGLLTAEISWPSAQEDRVPVLSRQLLSDVRAIPGVEFAATTSVLPVQSQGPDGGFQIEGRPLPSNVHDYPWAWYRLVSTDYFQALRIPLERGRLFQENDDRGPQVAVVNEAFAKHFFPGRDALGQRIRFLGFDRKPQYMEIVGLVPDVRSLGLGLAPEPEVFADIGQHPRAYFTLVVKGPESTAARIRSVVAALSRDVPVTFHPMDQLVAQSIERQRFQAALLALFAALALVLASVGIYGVQSYMVDRRTNELGIRLALGARPRTVLWMILREGGRLIVTGVAVGVAGALALTRTLSSLLYGVTASDPATFLVISALLGAVALLACFAPARRAAAKDPVIALRYE